MALTSPKQLSELSWSAYFKSIWLSRMYMHSLQRSNCTFMIWMTLFSRETTASKSFCATVCAPMMAITDSNSTRICLNHSSYTEGRGGMEKAGMVWKNGLVGWMGAWQEIVYDMYSSYTCSVHLDGSDVAVYSLHMHAGTTQSHPPTHPPTHTHLDVWLWRSAHREQPSRQLLCFAEFVLKESYPTAGKNYSVLSPLSSPYD